MFTELLRREGYASVGVDISPKLVALGRGKYSGLELIEGDAENLPFASESLNGVLLSGLLHHFPDPKQLIAEVRRVLKPGGRFVSFDPNRMNPFMWLYRDRASPFYSPVGVTENERPILAWRVAEMFRKQSFRVQSQIARLDLAISLRLHAPLHAGVATVYNVIGNVAYSAWQ